MLPCKVISLKIETHSEEDWEENERRYDDTAVRILRTWLSAISASRSAISWEICALFALADSIVDLTTGPVEHGSDGHPSRNGGSLGSLESTDTGELGIHDQAPSPSGFRD